MVRPSAGISTADHPVRSRTFHTGGVRPGAWQQLAITTGAGREGDEDVASDPGFELMMIADCQIAFQVAETPLRSGVSRR